MNIEEIGKNMDKFVTTSITGKVKGVEMWAISGWVAKIELSEGFTISLPIGYLTSMDKEKEVV